MLLLPLQRRNWVTEQLHDSCKVLAGKQQARGSIWTSKSIFIATVQIHFPAIHPAMFYQQRQATDLSCLFIPSVHILATSHVNFPLHFLRPSLNLRPLQSFSFFPHLCAITPLLLVANIRPSAGVPTVGSTRGLERSHEVWELGQGKSCILLWT